MIHFICDVAIIGAGLAGLAAADLLKSSGYEVKIAEATNRVGGRVLTYHLSDEGHFEQGAFSFGNEERPLWDYIYRFSLPVIEHTPITRIFWFNHWVGFINENGAFLPEKEQAVPLYQLVSYFRKKLDAIIDDMPLVDALHSIGASSEAIEWLQSNTIVGLLGNDTQNLSTHALLTFLKQYDTSTSFYAFRGGNDQLPQAFFSQLQENILLNHRVTKVEQLEEQCILYGDAFTITARRVIFAIPLAEMKNIKIDPPLSASKQQAMEKIPYTSCANITMIAPPAVLDALPKGGVFLFSDRLGWFREQTAFQIHPDVHTVLNISMVGKKAQRLAEQSDEWEQSIHAALSMFYPSWNSQQTKSYVHFWRNGYSSFPADAWHLHASLREVENRLHFAGEHTSQKFASMNGAIESGIRVAKEILNVFH